jgi:hypothetical protein
MFLKNVADHQNTRSQISENSNLHIRRENLSTNSLTWLRVVVTSGLTLQSLLVRILAGTTAMLTEVFRDFPQSVKVNS